MSDVSDPELPHNFRTVEETGWNSERNVGSAGAVSEVDAEATVIGAAARVSGKLCRKLAFSNGAVCAALATAVVVGAPPTAAIALRDACELAAAV